MLPDGLELITLISITILNVDNVETIIHDFILCISKSTGLCGGVADPPVLSLPGRYFMKRRITAYAISFIGSSLCTMVLPAVLTVSRETYGFRGTMMIMAGIWLQGLLIPAVAWPMDDNDSKYHGNAYEELEGNVSHTIEGNHSAERQYHIGEEKLDDKQQIVAGTGQMAVFSEKSNMLLDTTDTKMTLCTYVVQKYKVLLSDRQLFLVYFIIFSGLLSYYNIYFILPPLAKELGVEQLQTAKAFAVLSTIEICSRLVSSYIIDRWNIRKDVFLMATYTIMVVIGLAISMSLSINALFWFVVLFGMFGGQVNLLCIPAMMDVVSESHKGAVSGMFPFFAGIAVAIGPVILGKVHSMNETLTYCC